MAMWFGVSLGGSVVFPVGYMSGGVPYPLLHRLGGFHWWRFYSLAGFYGLGVSPLYCFPLQVRAVVAMVKFSHLTNFVLNKKNSVV